MYNSPLEDPSDLWFYGAAPLAGYVCLASIAFSLGSEFEYAPHLLGLLTVGLILLHIRNAWDLVTWIAPRVEEIKHYDDPAPATASNTSGEANTA
jgi:hypothetical protein